MSLYVVAAIVLMAIIAGVCGREMKLLARQFLKSFIDCCAWLKAMDDFTWRP